MFFIDWRSRTRAAGLHLIATLLVALTAAALVFWVWYPFPYSAISGGRELFLLVVAVDVVAGPVLTFAIASAKKGRPELIRDVTMIVLIQLGALGYGLYSVFVARPVYLVFEVDRFKVVTRADIEIPDLATATLGFDRLPVFGPKLISTRLPRDNAERNESIFQGIAGKDPSVRPGWWQAYELASDRVLTKSKSIVWLKQKNPSQHAAIDIWVRSSGLAEADARVVPLVGRVDTWSVLIDARTAKPVGFGPFEAF